MRRFVVALTTGLLVVVIAGFALVSDLARGFPKQRSTQFRLHGYSKTIDRFQDRAGAPPSKLRDLFDSDETRLYEEMSRDGWDRPFYFQTDRQTCTVTSYGRDGVPGGVGVDCDLTQHDPWPEQSRATLMQGIREPRLRPMWETCIAAGVFTFLLCLFLARPSELTHDRWRTTFCLIAGVAVMSTLVGSVLAAVHVFHGSGH